MQKAFYLLLLFSISLNVFSQNTYPYPQSGDLGIGTTTPSSKLDVTTNTLGTTQTTTSGLALVNTTAAASGAQQISPALRWSAKGWKTDITPTVAGSRAVDFRAFVTPIQGTANPSGYLSFGSSIAGATYNDNHLVLTTDGNAGIGTTAPGARLDVQSSSGTTEQLRLSNSNGSYTSFTVATTGALTVTSPSSNPVTFNTGIVASNDASNFYMPSFAGGSVKSNSDYLIGGASSTAFRIAMRGSGAHTLITGNSMANFLVGYHLTNASGTHSLISQQAIKSPRLNLGTTGTVTNAATLYVEGASTVPVGATRTPTNNYALWVDDGLTRLDGKVGINTDNPGNYHLAVAGDIIGKKVRVTQTTSPWPDYVFSSGYKLPSLSEVEQFISQNKHLPDVPSAAEIEKEGLELGDGQAILLKKVEELTLYLIQLKKQMDEQQKVIEALRQTAQTKQ